MVQDSLVGYVKNLLQQGYESSAIRTTLLNAGYSYSEVESAMHLAGAPAGGRISQKVLIVGFLILLVLAGGTLRILKLLQAPPVVLSFSMGLFSSKVSVGQNLVVNFDIMNPSNRGTDGLIDVAVFGPSGRIVSRTESFYVVDRASVASSVSLRDVLPGAYTVEATLSYGSKSSVKSAGFEVVESVEVLPGEGLKEKVVEQAKASQLICPGGCDDLNFCTSDACVNGVCVYSPIVPCCGNSVCESGETVSSCAIDCGERVTPDAIKARAKSLAVSNLPAAIETCESMAQRPLIDGCLNEISDASGSKVPCVGIVDSDVRDSCYIAFAYLNDFSVCSEISNPYMRNSCVSLAGLTDIQKSLPQD